MASVGWVGACPKGIRLAAEAVTHVEFSGRQDLPTTMRAQGPGPMPRRTRMRFYQQPHAFYCGVDLHARTLYLCVLNQAGEKLLHREVPSGPAALLAVLAPFREGLVIAAECMFA